ncbi:MAG: DNA replication protein [Alphaproteobacteria bacterium]|nr:DNA replication protein [Alphaproteobacteria bacterium]
MTQQLILDLGHRTARGRSDFLVSACNAEAVEWVDRWPDWPTRALVIWGPAGAGKTHLGHVWCASSGALNVDAATVLGEDAATLRDRNANIFVDDAEALSGDAAGEEALLHLYNYLLETDGGLLIAARRPPAHWHVDLADLSSRLNALPAAGIAAPDDELLAALLVKQFQDRQVRVGGDVVSYLIARMERSFAAVTRTVAAVDAAALERQRPVTVPLVREVLEDFGD